MKILLLIALAISSVGCATIDDAYAKHFGTIITYETIASQKSRAEEVCGKDKFRLYNGAVSVEENGTPAWFICK